MLRSKRHKDNLSPLPSPTTSKFPTFPDPTRHSSSSSSSRGYAARTSIIALCAFGTILLLFRHTSAIWDIYYDSEVEGRSASQDSTIGNAEGDVGRRGGTALQATEQWYNSSEPLRLCPDCDCSVPGSYAISPSFTTPVLSLPSLRATLSTSTSRSLPNLNTPSVARYLFHHILLASTLDGLFLSEEAISFLLTQHFTCPDGILALEFSGLALDRPTSYIYTRTGPGGKLADPAKRARYMQRHVEVMKEYQKLVAEKGFADGKGKDDRQLLWMVIEDEAVIEKQIEDVLRASGIPFIYLAHGPTNSYGKAQWNVALHAVQVLRDSLFGDGPVLNLDDDCRIVPELLRKIWKVRRAIVWQVGNYHCHTWKSWWEGPIYKDGDLVRWQHANNPNRLFPIDMNGFAIHSSEIGINRTISGPQYIPFDGVAGENEFLQNFYQHRDDIEPLCENTRAENCYYTWHNSWMEEDWDYRRGADKSPEGDRTD